MTNTILPEGWEWKTLGEVVKYKKGKKPKMLSDTKFEGSVPYLDIRTLEHGNVFQYADVKSSNILKETDLAVVWDGARAGWVSKGKNGAMGSTIMGLEYLYNCPNYLFYFLKCQFEIINSNPRGTGIPHVDPSIFWYLKIPIPPLAEQQRIAARLDEMMEAVENAKKRIGQIPEKMKQFRQAVLAQAVSGRLTEDWREENEIFDLPVFSKEKEYHTIWRKTKLPRIWTYGFVSEIAESKLGKMLDKSKNKGEYTRYIGNINVRWFKFNLIDLQEIRVTKEEKNKYLLEPNDILVCEGGEPGRAAIWTEKSSDIIFQKALHRIRLKSFILPKFFIYNLKYDADSELLNILFTGTTIKHFTGRNFSKYPVPLPPLAEQQEIVRRVESLFEYADGIEAKYAALKEKMEQLPQAILAKAFRGEL